MSEREGTAAIQDTQKEGQSALQPRLNLHGQSKKNHANPNETVSIVTAIENKTFVVN